MDERIISTVVDFERIISEVQFGRLPFVGEQYQELYRGQSKSSYELKSGISRYAESSEDIKLLEKNVINDFKEIVKNCENLNKFIQLSKYNDDFQNDWRWLEQIQHYRLPTRLLDWTLNPKMHYILLLRVILKIRLNFGFLKARLHGLVMIIFNTIRFLRT